MADEIIVVDTGSQDRSCEIAKKFGAQVFHFPWQDDFAQARNFSLEKATGNWILIIDADEVLSSKDYPLIRHLSATPAVSPEAYTLLTHNYINLNNIVGWCANDDSYPKEEKGSGWITSSKTRIWSNDKRIRFNFPVHELVEPSLRKLGISAQPCSIIIHHYGKLDQKNTLVKGEKYFLLGLRKLEEMSSDIAPLRELAIQAGILKRHHDAIELWQRLITIAPDNAEAYLNLGTALFDSGQFDSALSAAVKACQLKPLYKESYFNRSLYQIHLGRHQEAIETLEKLLLQVPNYQAASFLLASGICCRDNKQAGRQAFRKIRTDNLTTAMIAIAGNELANTLIKAGRKQEAEEIKKATEI